MAQALAETIFDALYLSFAIVIGLLLIRKGAKGSLVRRFGAKSVKMVLNMLLP